MYKFKTLTLSNSTTLYNYTHSKHAITRAVIFLYQTYSSITHRVIYDTNI